METSFQLIEKSGETKFQYCRSLYQQERKLSSLISENYGCDFSFICSSGLNAIEVVLRSYQFRYRNHDIYCLHPSQMYPETKNLIEFYYESGFFHSIQQFDLCVPFEKLLNALEKIPSSAEILLFVESCSNPNGLVFDFELFSNLGLKNVTLVVDNTWLTNHICNPFDYGAHIVIESLSKYQSAGNVISGSISTNCKIFGEFYLPHVIKVCGIHISFQDCEQIIATLSTTQERLLKCSTIFQQLINNLLSLENVVEIQHPFLIHHQSHSIFTRITKNKNLFPPVFSIKVKVLKGVQHFKDMIKLWKIPMMTSFGGALSRIDPHFEFISTTMVTMRISIGYDDDLFVKNFICFIETLKHNEQQNKL